MPELGLSVVVGSLSSHDRARLARGLCDANGNIRDVAELSARTFAAALVAPSCTVDDARELAELWPAPVWDRVVETMNELSGRRPEQGGVLPGEQRLAGVLGHVLALHQEMLAVTAPVRRMVRDTRAAVRAEPSCRPLPRVRGRERRRAVCRTRVRSSAGTMRGVSWPPIVGEQLPRAGEAFGIHDKLAAYCLDLDHEVGGPKAEGFQRILGIGIADIGYLADALRAGIHEAQITEVRDNAPYGVLCEIRIRVGGLREHRDRVAAVTTSWELRHARDRPRLVTAYIDG